MARRTGSNKPTVWRGSKYKTSNVAEQQGIYGATHLNHFQMGAQRMRDPGTFYRSKYFERTGQVPSHVPSDFINERKTYKSQALKSNLATVGAIAVSRNLAVRAHPVLGVAHMAAFSFARNRYMAGTKKNLQDIMERETKRKQSYAMTGGYYTRVVGGKKQRVRRPKSS